jgi:hypothetical protein
MCTQKKVVELFDVTVDEYIKEKMQIAVLSQCGSLTSVFLSRKIRTMICAKVVMDCDQMFVKGLF